MFFMQFMQQLPGRCQNSLYQRLTLSITIQNTDVCTTAILKVVKKKLGYPNFLLDHLFFSPISLLFQTKYTELKNTFLDKHR